MVVRVGLIGCGAIGGPVLAALDDGRISGAVCVAALVQRPREGPDSDPRLTTNADDFFASTPDLIVECAGHEALRSYGVRALTEGSDLMITSMGAFGEPGLLEAMERAAETAAGKLILLSASIWPAPKVCTTS